MKLRLLASVAAQQLLFLGNVIAASECGDGSAAATTTITNSGDISSLAGACPTVSASIYIKAGAGVEIGLDGIETIQGGLSVEDCTASACDEEIVTKISSATLKLVEGGVQIAGLQGLTELSFPNLEEIRGTTSIEALNGLDTLDVSSLVTVDNLTIANVPRLYYLGIGLLQANMVSISGNDELVLRLDHNSTNTGTSPNLISRLDIAGIGELRWAALDHNVAVENLSIHDTTIPELPLLFSSIQSLNVSNNKDMTDLLFPTGADAQTQLFAQLRRITVRNNEKLNMTTVRSLSWNNTDMLTWVWPEENMDSVVLDGIIHNAFFQPLVDTHKTTTAENANSSKSRVLYDFNVTSSASTFHCEPIDEMRRHGVFPGNYSCNGDSIAMLSSAISIGGMRGFLLIYLMVALAAGQLLFA